MYKDSVKRWCYIVICILFYVDSHAVTLVYNLRVRRIFAIAPVLQRFTSRKVWSVVPIYFFRNSTIVPTLVEDITICEQRRVGGSLFNLRYIHSKHWWLEVTTGIETDHGDFTGDDIFRASRTGFDDIVLASGYRHFIGQRGQLVGYSLIGLPTRRTVTLEDRYGPFVGTRLYNIGIGLEGSYGFVSLLRRSLSFIVQGRFIHGFNRSWVPILPKNARIQPGNVSDLLYSVQYRNKRTIVETGYDLTIFSQQAIRFPTETISTPTFVRHGGYLTVSHLIPKALLKKPVLVGMGGNINHSNRFDTTSIAIWIFGSLIF